MIEFKAVRGNVVELNKYAAEGHKLGLSTGSKTLDSILSVKRGYPWFIGGLPSHGKTEFTMELLLSWSIRYGWKHCCYFGEGGSVIEVIADLCYKFIGRPYLKTILGHMDDRDREYAHAFIDEHFIFLELEGNEIMYHDFLSSVEEYEKTNQIKFDTVTFDPWNDIHYELKEYGNVSYWLKDVLKKCREASKKFNRIDILVNHIGDVQPIVDKETGFRYRPKASAEEWEGGRLWPRRAFVMVNIWRPPIFLKQEDGEPFTENMSVISVQKAKPKGIGSIGHVVWQWDFKRNRYKECVGQDNFGKNFREILDKETYNRDDPKNFESFIPPKQEQLPLNNQEEETPF